MPKILVIEDMKGVRRAMVSLLREKGHEVSEAGDGREAIEILKFRSFDLIITEVLMPDLDGTEVLNFLETQPQKPPVIAISGGNSQIPAEMALLIAKTQATATLCKPVDEAALLAVVDKLLTPAA